MKLKHICDTYTVLNYIYNHTDHTHLPKNDRPAELPLKEISSYFGFDTISNFKVFIREFPPEYIDISQSDKISITYEGVNYLFKVQNEHRKAKRKYFKELLVSKTFDIVVSVITSLIISIITSAIVVNFYLNLTLSVK